MIVRGCLDEFPVPDVHSGVRNFAVAAKDAGKNTDSARKNHRTRNALFFIDAMDFRTAIAILSAAVDGEDYFF
jgi:hypothetical protein